MMILPGAIVKVPDSNDAYPQRQANRDWLVNVGGTFSTLLNDCDRLRYILKSDSLINFGF
ncbi:MAG: hypothetical protein AAF298_17055 [Cyanobacteria bacterium P01_A01_bin.40]